MRRGTFSTRIPLRDAASSSCIRRRSRSWPAEAAERGYTLMPLQVYFKNGRAKMEVGLCRGKKLYDKRQDIAKEGHAQGSGTGIQGEKSLTSRVWIR